MKLNTVCLIQIKIWNKAAKYRSMNQFAKYMTLSIFVDHFVPCDVQGSRHLLSFGYDDHLSSGPEVQEEEREGGTADTPEVPEMWNEKY